MQAQRIALKWFLLGFVCALFFITTLYSLKELWFAPNEEELQKEEKSAFLVGNMDGVEKVSPYVKSLLIRFSSGEVRIDPHQQTGEMNWDCDGAGKSAQIELDPETQEMSLDLSSAIIDCDIRVPNLPLRIEGTHGELQLRRIVADMDIKLLNGEILWQPDPQATYNYDIKIESGTVDETLHSSNDAKAIKMRVEMKFGSIEKLD